MPRPGVDFDIDENEGKWFYTKTNYAARKECPKKSVRNQKSSLGTNRFNNKNALESVKRQQGH